MYETNGWFKDAEKDNWQNGCTGDGLRFAGNECFSADTVDDLVDKLCDFVGVEPEPDNYALDACEEQGRIDICRMENADGYEPTLKELEQFKDGLIDLWYCVYTFHVEQVTRNSVALS